MTISPSTLSKPRVRTYRYKVVHVELQDYAVTPMGGRMPVYTTFYRTTTSDKAKDYIRSRAFRDIVILSATRYPENLGTLPYSSAEVLTPTQMATLENNLKLRTVPAPVQPITPPVPAPVQRPLVGDLSADQLGVLLRGDVLSVGGYTVGAIPAVAPPLAKTTTAKVAPAHWHPLSHLSSLLTADPPKAWAFEKVGTGRINKYDSPDDDGDPDDVDAGRHACELVQAAISAPTLDDGLVSDMCDKVLDDMNETEKTELFHQLVADGMSESEVRGTIWPGTPSVNPVLSGEVTTSDMPPASRPLTAPVPTDEAEPFFSDKFVTWGLIAIGIGLMGAVMYLAVAGVK